MTGLDLVSGVSQLGDKVAHALQQRRGQHPFVGDIRGVGLFRGVEFVNDRSTKEPCDPSLKINARIKAASMEEGLICYPMGGTVDGKSGNHVLFAPPFITSDDQIEELADKFTSAVKTVFEKEALPG